MSIKKKNFLKLRISKVISLSVCLILSYCNNVFSQDFNKAFTNLRKAQIEIKNLDAMLEISFYKGTQNIDVKKAYIIKEDQNYYTEINDLVTVFMPKYAVMLNKQQQFMWVNFRPKTEIKFVDQFIGLNMDSLLAKSTKQISFIEKKDGLSHYLVRIDNDVIFTVEYFIDENKNELRKMKYYYNTQNYPQYTHVVIEFKKFDTNPTDIKKYFIENNYFITTKTGFSPSGIYSKYILIKK